MARTIKRQFERRIKMKLNVKVNENDFIRFNEYYMKNSSHGRHSTLLSRLLLPAIFLVIIMICLVAKADLMVIILEVIIFSIATVAWELKTPAFIRNNIKRNIETVKNDGKLPYHEKAEFEFNDESIIETTQNSVLKINYSDVVSVKSTEEYIYIFFGATQAFIIPRRCIGSEYDLDEFLKEHVK